MELSQRQKKVLSIFLDGKEAKFTAAYDGNEVRERITDLVHKYMAYLSAL